ncbi:AAA family ATPase [Brevundimonas sp. WCHBH090558]|uniref:ParA family partition ATPase n=1 Tax=Brevundimonas huaxiensis TaxID=2725493 RepID=UPI001626BB36|nr:ParA family partition ATPase [Brevundimonas huaxiensis]MBC1184027.1 AAA family ATPase [Brevundimonas huaxiensis]
MHTIAIISQKGGSGKTTLALHLAAAATAAGRVALVVDTDPQATASRWGEWRDGADPEVISCAAPPLLPKTLEQAAQLGAELAIIDTPPHADSMAAAACRAADLILIPCRPRAFDLDAIQTTADLVKMSGKPAAVIFTAGPPNAPRLYADAAELVTGFGLEVAPVILPQRAAYSDATGSGQTAPEIDAGSRAAEEVAALWDCVCQLASIPTRQRANKKGRAAA